MYRLHQHGVFPFSDDLDSVLVPDTCLMAYAQTCLGVSGIDSTYVHACGRCCKNWMPALSLNPDSIPHRSIIRRNASALVIVHKQPGRHGWQSRLVT